MHAAPPVRVTFGRSGAWVTFACLVAGVAVANVAAWGLLRLGASLVPLGAAIAGTAMALAAGALAWRHQVPGTLDWDGSQWHWAGRDGQVQVCIDLNRWMLLRFDACAGGRCWIAASRAAAAGPWAGLRAALYSRRPSDSGAAPPA